MSTQTCCSCGILFAMPQEVEQRYRESHENFFCPKGHPQHYSGLSEAEKLKRALANEEQKTKWASERADRAQAEADHFRRSRDGMKGALRKVAVRVKNGVCPCCKRTFKCLADHMKEKHPNFSAETVAP